MSRIGNQPITLPAKVEVAISGGEITVKGPLGSLSRRVAEGVTVTTPTQTEILIKGADRQKVGQVAAEVRGYKPPEPYKGKGVRYADEVVVIKETKKK